MSEPWHGDAMRFERDNVEAPLARPVAAQPGKNLTAGDLLRIAAEFTTRHPRRVASVTLSPTDRAVLLYRLRADRHYTRTMPIVLTSGIGGITVTESDWMAEGRAALFDEKGRLITIIRLGDHVP